MLIIVLLLYEKVNFIFPIKSYKVLKNSIVRSRFEFTSVVGWPFESVDKSVTIQMKAAVVISCGTVYYAKQLGVTKV